MHKLLASSANPDKISLTIKGVGLGLIPIALFGLKGFGFDVLEGDLVSLVENFATIVASFMIVWGLLRKAYYALV